MKKELLKNGLFCYTDPLHKFTLDALILAELLPQSSSSLELCAGTGVIGLSALDRFESVDFVEISPLAAELLEKALKEQELDGCRCFCCDARDFPSACDKKYDLIFFNPPYYKEGSGILPRKKERAQQNFELFGTLKDFLSVAKLLTHKNSKVIFVINPERKNEALSIIDDLSMYVERLDTFFHDPDSTAFLCCITVGLENCSTIMNQTYLMQQGKYTEFYKNLYKLEDK